MWRFDGRFDPLSGTKLDARLETAVQALFAEETPDTCPTDPVLEAATPPSTRLPTTGAGRRSRGSGTTGPTRDDHRRRRRPTRRRRWPTVDWGIPVELPDRVLADMCHSDTTDVHAVVVRNGVILHAPGELDLGRTTRLANRAQRRALRALYSTCAIPGCTIRYRRCKLHHVTWWRNGGRTDLDNLLPICTHHHSQRPRRRLEPHTRTQPRTHHHLPRRHHPQHRPTQPTSRMTGGPVRARQTPEMIPARNSSRSVNPSSSPSSARCSSVSNPSRLGIDVVRPASCTVYHRETVWRRPRPGLTTTPTAGGRHPFEPPPLTSWCGDRAHHHDRRRHHGPWRTRTDRGRDDWPRPQVGPGQALVRVTAAPVNDTDIWSHQGAYGTAPRPDTIVGWKGVPLDFPRIRASTSPVRSPPSAPTSTIVGRQAGRRRPGHRIRRRLPDPRRRRRGRRRVGSTTSAP